MQMIKKNENSTWKTNNEQTFLENSAYKKIAKWIGLKGKKNGFVGNALLFFHYMYIIPIPSDRTSSSLIDRIYCNKLDVKMENRKHFQETNNWLLSLVIQLCIENVQHKLNYPQINRVELNITMDKRQTGATL